MVFNDSPFISKLRGCSTVPHFRATRRAPYFSPISHPQLPRQRESPPVNFCIRAKIACKSNR